MIKIAIKCLFVLAVWFWALPCKAQNQAQVPLTDSINSPHVEISPVCDSASNLFSVHEYYAGNQIKATGSSSAAHYLKLQGAYTTFFKNGQRSSVAFYKDSRLVGEQTFYYPDGKIYLIIAYPASDSVRVTPFHNPLDYTIKANYDSLGKPLVVNGEGYCKAYNSGFTGVIKEEGPVTKGKRNGEWKAIADSGKVKLTETYANGKLLKGTALYKDGNTSSYSDTREVSPDYKGGTSEFYKFLSKHVEYPADAYKNHIQGRAIIQFVVEKDGSVSNVKALSAPNADIARAAVRVISLSRKWIPGTQYGHAVRVQYSIPMDFHYNP